MDDVDVHLLLFPYSMYAQVWVKKLMPDNNNTKHTDSGLHFHVYIHIECEFN
jgi:hypothetical protein